MMFTYMYTHASLDTGGNVHKDRDKLTRVMCSVDGSPRALFSPGGSLVYSEQGHGVWATVCQPVVVA